MHVNKLLILLGALLVTTAVVAAAGYIIYALYISVRAAATAEHASSSLALPIVFLAAMSLAPLRLLLVAFVSGLASLFTGVALTLAARRRTRAAHCKQTHGTQGSQPGA